MALLLRAKGITKVRPLDHRGRFFQVQGPINMSRGPQGHPVIIQAGGSEAGLELAARTADVVFSVVQELSSAKAAYRNLKGRLAKYGRGPDQIAVLPGVMPIFSVDYLVSLGLLEERAAPVLRDIRAHNPLLFDFVLKRALRSRGKSFSRGVFETRQFFERRV